MATVYLARDLKHDRLVALKVMRPEVAAALGTERFQLEIGLAAKLQHPHILPVHDSGDVDGHLWFTMPYVEGESLSGLLGRSGPMPLQQVVTIAGEIVRALEYAHQHRIVHRDIKPDNILLATDGSTLVADFGVARSLATQAIHLTETGITVGTPAYMSPEQATGDRSVDARTDVYSLAVVVFEMLTGELPFKAPSASAILRRRFTESPPLVRKLRPDVPPAVEQVLVKAMAVEPGQRFTTAQEFGQALQQAAATAPAGEGRRRGQIALAGILLLAVVAALGWALRSGRDGARSSEPPEEIGIAVLPFVNLGDGSDAYFADGVSDEVRGRLTEIPGLVIVARTSSVSYGNSTRPLRQIAQELGVKYLLTGTVRWARQRDGTSRVQVSPELIEVGDGHERSRWQKAFDAPLTEVFQVQGEIAAKVADALNVELTAPTARQLAGQPTRDLIAYDMYLQALALVGNKTDLKRIGLLKQAVARDPGFGVAWGVLASAYNSLTDENALPERRQRYGILGDSAMARAQALTPRAVETYVARLVRARVRAEHDSGLAIAREGTREHPNNADLMGYLGYFEAKLGQRDSGLVHMETARRLDPRSLSVLNTLCTQYLTNNDPVRARRAGLEAINLAPGSIGLVWSVMVTYLFEGHLAEARRFMDEEASGERLTLLSGLAQSGDMWWLMSRAQQDSVLPVPSGGGAGSDPGVALAWAQIYLARGDRKQARYWADSATSGFRIAMRAGEDPQFYALAGLAEAIGGREATAREFFARADRLVRSDSNLPSYLALLRIRATLMLGHAEEALGLIERAPVSMFGYYPQMLRQHPEFLVLKGNPRYQQLLSKL